MQALISSRLFVFAAAGVCLGLSDVWRFPYLLLEHGSAWFPILYLLAVILVGTPLLVAELALARLGHSHPSTNFGFLVKEDGGNPLWQYAGIVVLLAVFLILCYTTVVAGWMMAYAVRAAVGGLEAVSAGAARLVFQSLVTDPERLLGWHTLFLLGLGWVVAKGVEAGVGRYARGMVIAIFAIAIGLCGLSLFERGLEPLRALYEAVQASGLSLGLLSDALVQAFFTLGVCMGAIMILGTHLSPGARVVPLVLSVVLLDVLFVALASVTMMPVLLDVEVPTEGISLAVETVPVAVSSGGALGRAQLAAFYVMLLLLVSTTALVLMEFLVSWIGEKTGKARSAATAIASIAVWFGGLLALLSFSAFSFSFEFAGRQKNFGLFDVMDILSSHILLPVIGLLMAVFVGWNIDRETFQSAIGWQRTASMLHHLKRYLVPTILAAIFIILVFGQILPRV